MILSTKIYMEMDLNKSLISRKSLNVINDNRKFSKLSE